VQSETHVNRGSLKTSWPRILFGLWCQLGGLEFISERKAFYVMDQCHISLLYGSFPRQIRYFRYVTQHLSYQSKLPLTFNLCFIDRILWPFSARDRS
jgi:hypothetical protein